MRVMVFFKLLHQLHGYIKIFIMLIKRSLLTVIHRWLPNSRTGTVSGGNLSRTWPRSAESSQRLNNWISRETFTGKALSRCHDAEMETLHWKEQEGLLQFFICLSSGSSVALLALLKIKVSKGLFCSDSTK